jgi:hypothetical protein
MAAATAVAAEVVPTPAEAEASTAAAVAVMNAAAVQNLTEARVAMGDRPAPEAVKVAALKLAGLKLGAV